MKDAIKTIFNVILVGCWAATALALVAYGVCGLLRLNT